VDLVNYGVNGDEILDVEVQRKAEKGRERQRKAKSVDNARWTQLGFKIQNWSKKPIVPMLQPGKTSMPLNPSLQIDSAAGSIYLNLVILREAAGTIAVADRAFKSPPF